MPLNEYRCSRCGDSTLRFADSPVLGDGNCGEILRWCHNWQLMPPRPNIVIATALFMQDYQLDSWASVYELDRQLNIEAREAKELDFYQHHKRNA